MELIYIYIEKFNNGMKQQEINFSPNFNVCIKNNKLVVEKKVSYVSKLYGANIKNISMLLGKNGAGKTTVLDILGMNWYDRCKVPIRREKRSRRKVYDSYIILYHIDDDYFGIEVMDSFNSKDRITKLFKQVMNNFNFDNLKDAFYKIPMGLILKKDGDVFHVVEHFFREYEGYRISQQIGINYITNHPSDRIDTRYSHISGDEDNYEKDDYFCKRRYFMHPCMKMKYVYANNLNNKGSMKNLNFSTEDFNMSIIPDFDYALESIYSGRNDIEAKEHEIMEKRIVQLENLLFIDKSERINFLPISSQEDYDDEIEEVKYKCRDEFILNTLASFIIHYFIKGICSMIGDNRGKRLKSDDTYLSTHIDLLNSQHINFLEDLRDDSNAQGSSKSILGELSNKDIEYKSLLNVISYYMEQNDLDVYRKFIYISRYLYSRMESTIGLGSDSRYQIAIEEFMQAVSRLKEEYFHKNRLIIGIDSDIDEQVVTVLDIYDDYLNSNYSDLKMRFKINFTGLSEGQLTFLEILSRIFYIVSKAKENQLSIILLDEPDQSLHPEWSRLFIDLFCKEMKKYPDKIVQLVIASHSPFMVTDIISEHVYCLEKLNLDQCNKSRNNDESKFKIYPLSNKMNEIHNTFGANIYDILKSSFILEKTIGEFSYTKITDLIKALKSDSCQYDLEYERFLINSIGEPMLRKKLGNMYEEKRQKCFQLKKNIIEQLRTETDMERLDKIRNILSGEKND